MIGLAVIVGEVIGSSLNLNFQKVLIGFLTGFFLLASTMAINDYFDFEIDLINNPKRPIPLGLINKKEAIFLGIIFSIIGLSLAAFTSIVCFLIAIFSVFLMLYYNSKLKKTGLLGNIVVSFCVAIPFIYGSAVINGFKPLIIIFALIAFITNLAREIIKGIADITGDSLKNVKTIAIKYGINFATKFSIFLIFLAIVLSIVPFLMKWVSILYVPMVLLSNLGLIFSSISLIKDNSIKNALKVKNKLLLWMLFGLLAFLFGSYNLD